MSNIIGKYKGYVGSFEYDERSETVWGKLLFIRDLVTFESLDGTPASLKEQFHLSVDEYLADCEEEGIAPELPAKGSFNVRVTHEIHMEALLYARKHDIKLNNVVQMALEEKLANNGLHIHHHEDHNHFYQDHLPERSTATEVASAAVIRAQATFESQTEPKELIWTQH